MVNMFELREQPQAEKNQTSIKKLVESGPVFSAYLGKVEKKIRVSPVQLIGCPVTDCAKFDSEKIYEANMISCYGNLYGQAFIGHVIEEGMSCPETECIREKVYCTVPYDSVGG